jgi:hypothetical protein
MLIMSLSSSFLQEPDIHEQDQEDDFSGEDPDCEDEHDQDQSQVL